MTYCVTGPMAAGKNFVCANMVREDARLAAIDLDKTAHAVIERVSDQIFSAFEEEARSRGIRLRNQDGSLNRRAMGRLVFSEPELLARHEAIVYPKVVECALQFVRENEAHGKSTLINAAVLYKTPELLDLCDRIYFVTAPFVTRLVRARRRDGLPLAQILSRFWSQRRLLSAYKKTGKEIVIVRNH